jgi:hypothetical protein
VENARKNRDGILRVARENAIDLNPWEFRFIFTSWKISIFTSITIFYGIKYKFFC